MGINQRVGIITYCPFRDGAVLKTKILRNLKARIKLTSLFFHNPEI